MHVNVYFRVRPCLCVMCVCLCSCVPQDMDILKDLSDTYNNMAEVLDCMEQYSDALRMYQRSLKVCLHICIHVQPIPLGVTFSNEVSKLKAQSSNVSFH